MRKRPRNIGQEILLGLRQLKRGTVGRVMTPPIAGNRKNKGAVHPRAPRERF